MDMDFLLNLQRFSDGAAGDGGGASAGGAGTASGADGQGDAAPVYSRANRRTLLAEQKFGAQAQAQPKRAEVREAQDAAANTEDEGKPARTPFEELIKGDYKADYDKRVQETIQKRLKAHKGTEDRLNALSPVLQMLGERYGIDTTDLSAVEPDAFVKALEQDKALYEDEALEAGVTVEQLMKQKSLERELAQFRTAQERAATEAEAAREYAGLAEQADALKQRFPTFDLESEMANVQFARMVLQPPRGAGVPIEAAFRAVHHQDIQRMEEQARQQLVAQTAQDAVKKAAQAVRSGSSRPTENGTQNRAPTVTTNDPRNWTREQMLDAMKRTRSGEKLRF